MSNKKSSKLLISEEIFHKSKPAKDIDFVPKKEYAIATQIRPSEPCNLQSDTQFKFEISTGRDEYLSFPDQHQMILETSVMKKTVTTTGGENPVFTH